MAKRKKESPIEKYKDKDVVELRKYLWEVVRDTKQATKDRNEASKQLAKLHGAQYSARPLPKSEVSKPSSDKKNEKAMTLTPEEMEEINKAFDFDKKLS